IFLLAFWPELVGRPALAPCPGHQNGSGDGPQKKTNAEAAGIDHARSPPGVAAFVICSLSVDHSDIRDSIRLVKACSSRARFAIFSQFPPGSSFSFSRKAATFVSALAIKSSSSATRFFFRSKARAPAFSSSNAVRRDDRSSSGFGAGSGFVFLFSLFGAGRSPVFRFWTEASTKSRKPPGYTSHWPSRIEMVRVVTFSRKRRSCD